MPKVIFNLIRYDSVLSNFAGCLLQLNSWVLIIDYAIN